jgi:hypothetical protein
MKKYEMIAVSPSENAIKEEWITASTEKEAWHKFWESMTPDQQNRTACIECVDVVEVNP